MAPPEFLKLIKIYQPEIHEFQNEFVVDFWLIFF